VLTYPLIGNYGVPDNVTENQLSGYFESEKIQVSGLVISDYSAEQHHWNAGKAYPTGFMSTRFPGSMVLIPVQ